MLTEYAHTFSPFRTNLRDAGSGCKWIWPYPPRRMGEVSQNGVEVARSSKFPLSVLYLSSGHPLPAMSKPTGVFREECNTDEENRRYSRYRSVENRTLTDTRTSAARIPSLGLETHSSTGGFHLEAANSGVGPAGSSAISTSERQIPIQGRL